MKCPALLTTLFMFHSLTAGAPVDTAVTTAADVTVVQAAAAAADKVPTCDTNVLWDYCLQSDDSLWCNGDGVLNFKTAELKAKCSGGCHCTISGL